MNFGEYFGHKTVIYENEFFRIECLAEAGPRIVRLIAQWTGENLFAEPPGASIKSPRGDFHLYGGHRLWRAPEFPSRTYVPDDTGLEVKEVPNGIKLVGAEEQGTGLRKSIMIQASSQQPFLTPVRPRALGKPAAVVRNRIPEPQLGKATRHYLVFEGGIGGFPAIGQVDGKPLKVEEIMAKHGLTWTMNYTAQHEHAMMHEPLFHTRKGEHVLLRMVNNSSFEHPMHLHGHFFCVLAFDGKPNPLREWRDTVLLGPRASCDVAFVADNVREWMLHCHILDHAAGGMMGTMVVDD